jgi:hypothetical protein
MKPGYIPVILSIAVDQSGGDIHLLAKHFESFPTVSIEAVLNTVVTPEFDRAFKHKRVLDVPIIHFWILATFDAPPTGGNVMTATFKHPMMETWVNALVPLNQIPLKYQSSTGTFDTLISCDFAPDGTIQSYFISEHDPRNESEDADFLPQGPDDFSNSKQVETYKKQLEQTLGTPVKPAWL